MAKITITCEKCAAQLRPEDMKEHAFWHQDMHDTIDNLLKYVLKFQGN